MSTNQCALNAEDSLAALSIPTLVDRVSVLEREVAALKASFDHGDGDPAVNAETPDYLTTDRTAAETCLRYMGITAVVGDDDAIALMRRARAIRQMRNRTNDAECDIPVRSQIGAWLLYHADTVLTRDWANSDLYAELSAFAEIQPDAINWKLRDNDELAFRWLDMAWKHMTRVPFQYPF